MQFDDGGELASIWDYDPPGDLAGSGAWNILRELATTLSRYGIAVSLPCIGNDHMHSKMMGHQVDKINSISCQI